MQYLTDGTLQSLRLCNGVNLIYVKQLDGLNFQDEAVWFDWAARQGLDRQRVIDLYRSLKGWEFIFLAANQDAIASASDLDAATAEADQARAAVRAVEAAERARSIAHAFVARVIGDRPRGRGGPRLGPPCARRRPRSRPPSA